MAVSTLVIAIVLGIAFGWALEAGGMGNARKLADQFYLRDFTVIKVMFSALVTAMLGTFWLGRAGVLDLSTVYVPETFLLPQAIGGVIFGAGFVLGGLCPGTSCVAAATGRKDGIAAVLGMFSGVFAFGLAGRIVEPLFNATSRGTLTIPALLHATYGAVVAVIAVGAVAMFLLIQRFELRTSSHAGTAPDTRRPPRAFAYTALGLGIVAIAAGQPMRDGGRIDVAALARAVANEEDHVSAPTLAGWIRNDRPGLRVIDIRSPAEFDAMHIPTAVNMSVESAAAIVAPLNTPIVLYSEGGTHAAQLWFMLRARGYSKVFFLREGMYEWVSRVMSPKLAVDATPEEIAQYREVVELSRYFGGVPRRDVPRSEVPDGYWLHDDEHGGARPGESGPGNARDANAPASRTSDAVDQVRRRGC
jgi:rhodanese-related sulfurtransferase/uncharacterized membrane protein YedE/YeeE